MRFVMPQRDGNPRIDELFHIGSPRHIASADKKALSLEQVGQGTHPRPANPHKVDLTHILQ